MAVDDKGGISKDNSMPWPRNSNDLKWFKKHTINQVVIMGRSTWEDPFMPTPLVSRVNVLFTNKDPKIYPGADHYLKGEIREEINKLKKNLKEDKNLFIIGGAELLNQAFALVQEFYLTRIYGNYNCDKFIRISDIEQKMTLDKKIECDQTCHFEIWKK